MRVQQILLARLNDTLKPFDLTFPRYEALMLLYYSRRGALPLGKMGDRLQVHRTSRDQHHRRARALRLRDAAATSATARDAGGDHPRGREVAARGHPGSQRPDFGTPRRWRRRATSRRSAGRSSGTAARRTPTRSTPGDRRSSTSTQRSSRADVSTASVIRAVRSPSANVGEARQQRRAGLDRLEDVRDEQVEAVLIALRMTGGQNRVSAPPAATAGSGIPAG